MDLPIETAGDATIVAVRTEQLDGGNAEEFKSEVAPALDPGGPVLFDMSVVQFVDSAGLGALLWCMRRVAAAGGSLKLYGLSRQVTGVLHMTRMHRLFEVFETRQQAMEAVPGGPSAVEGGHAAQA